MPVRFSLTIAVVLLWGAGAFAACVPNGRNCVDLGNIPQITEQIVGRETIPAAPAPAPPAADPATAYTGPTVGVSSMLRRAPTVGYHWAIE